MKKTLSRRQVLAASAAGTAAMVIAATPVFAGCRNDHKKIGYRLGALMVDPTLSTDEKRHLLVVAKCPSCGTLIEPDGMSYGEHMQG